jgi:hypothetical protein
MMNRDERSTIRHGLFLAEVFALLVAVATTSVPSKTGSKYGISDGGGYAVGEVCEMMQCEGMLRAARLC